MPCAVLHGARIKYTFYACRDDDDVTLILMEAGNFKDHSQKGLAAAKGSQPDITNGLIGHEGDGSGMYNITI